MNGPSDANRIHQRTLVAVLHDHRPIGADLPAMRAGGVTCKCYQVTLDVDVEAGLVPSRDRREGWRRQATAQMDAALREIDAHAGACRLARTAGDIERAKTENRVAILLGAEGSRWLEASLEPLQEFHRLGLRELQLCWAFPNEVVPDGRLSEFGRRVFRECHRLGIIVDLTHMADAAFDEVIGLAEAPVIVSHGACASVTTDLDDRKLRALASTGGMLGVHFYTTYLGPTPAPDDVVRQVDHVAQTVGIDHVGLGVDFFPTEGPWRKFQEDQGTTELTWAIADLSQMAQITEALVRRGYDEPAIQKVLGRNFLRICQEVFRA